MKNLIILTILCDFIEYFWRRLGSVKAFTKDTSDGCTGESLIWNFANLSYNSIDGQTVALVLTSNCFLRNYWRVINEICLHDALLGVPIMPFDTIVCRFCSRIIEQKSYFIVLLEHIIQTISVLVFSFLFGFGHHSS